ncbi:MAG TPA: calcium-binding protein [Solirubrobacteraceae bacterium]
MTVAVTVLLAIPSASQAFTASPLWKCRASALWASLNGENRVEPIVANGNPSTANNKSPDRAQCANEEAGAENLATPIFGLPTSVLSAKSLSAKTTIEPELGLAIDQKVNATSRVEKLDLPLGTSGVVLGVGAANSTVTGTCVPGSTVPKLEGTSSMLDLTLGGQVISLNELLKGLQDALAPLGVIVDIKFNEQIRDGNKSLIQRAAHIKLLGGNRPTPLLEVVIAESKVDTEQFTCDPDKQIPGFDNQICPTGSTFDVMTGFCVITRQVGGATQVIVVGRPFQGPSGGTVIPLNEARAKYGNKVCLLGAGPKYAVVGTNKADRITGTNGRDRILGLGGNDSLDGGRGADCIDGGTASDRIAGGIGSDRVIGDGGNDTLRGDLDNDIISGGSGNDKVSGGAGNDRMSGGNGRDILSGNYGADRITAGSGNDVINIATQGPRATANCGSGNDIIRLNGKERRSIRGCETAYVLKDR